MKTMIEVQGLYKSYQKRRAKDAIKAVDDVSFQVQAGEIVGLLGPNGAGKSTTIKMICGLIRPDQGNIWVNGVDARRQRLRALRSISAVLEGNRNLYWRLTVRENMEYFAGNRGRSRSAVRSSLNALLEQFQLEDKANELVNNLSRGMQQKLAIAVALLAETEVVLLDEPTLGLDVETSYEVRECLHDIAHLMGRTVIISTHDMSVVQDLCERTIIINQGRVVIDDQVAKLMRLFETRAYQISLAETLDVAQQNQLLSRFPVIEIATDALSLRVNLEHTDDIYELIEILKSQRTAIEAIDRTTINFEQVFRTIVKGQAQQEASYALA